MRSTQINQGNENSARGTIAFLEDTMREYNNYRKLQRYLDLSKKLNRTDDEKACMDEIARIESLQPFLPRK